MAKIPLKPLFDNLGLGKAKTPSEIEAIVKILKNESTRKKFLQQYNEMKNAQKGSTKK